jgi:hypothetical protein
VSVSTDRNPLRQQNDIIYFRPNKSGSFEPQCATCGHLAIFAAIRRASWPPTPARLMSYASCWTLRSRATTCQKYEKCAAGNQFFAAAFRRSKRLLASRDGGFPPWNRRGHAIPALTDHLEDEGGVIGLQIDCRVRVSFKTNSAILAARLMPSVRCNIVKYVD